MTMHRHWRMIVLGGFFLLPSLACVATTGVSARDRAGGVITIGGDMAAIGGSLGFAVHPGSDESLTEETESDVVTSFRGDLHVGLFTELINGFWEDNTKNRAYVFPRLFVGFDRTSGNGQTDTSFPVGLGIRVLVPFGRLKGLLLTPRYMYHTRSDLVPPRRHEFMFTVGLGVVPKSFIDSIELPGMGSF